MGEDIDITQNHSDIQNENNNGENIDISQTHSDTQNENENNDIYIKEKEEKLKQLNEALRMEVGPQHYDRGTADDSSQLIRASKTPGSEIMYKRYKGVPSRKRHSGD